MTYAGWRVEELANAMRFRRDVERLRELAIGAHRDGYSRSTGDLRRYKWTDLERLSDERLQPDRPRAWRNRDLPTDDGLRHVHNYMAGCRRLSREAFSSPRHAAAVHELVRREGYRLDVPSGALPFARPVEGAASSLAADISGASWGSGATALAQGRRRWEKAAFQRHETLHPESYVICREPCV